MLDVLTVVIVLLGLASAIWLQYFVLPRRGVST